MDFITWCVSFHVDASLTQMMTMMTLKLVKFLLTHSYSGKAVTACKFYTQC